MFGLNLGAMGGPPAGVISAAPPPSDPEPTLVASTTSTSGVPAMPTHQAGDLLIVAALSSTSDYTPPRQSPTAGWGTVKILPGSVGYSRGVRVIAKIAQSNAEASPSMTGAGECIAMSFRNVGAYPFGVAEGLADDSGTDFAWPTLSLLQTNKNKVLTIGTAANTGASPATPPTGMALVNRAVGASRQIAAHLSTGPETSFTGRTSPAGSALKSVIALEIRGITNSPTPTPWVPDFLSQSPQVWFDDTVYNVPVSAGYFREFREKANGFLFTSASNTNAPDVVASGLNGKRTARSSSTSKFIETDAANPSYKDQLLSGASDAWVVSVYYSANTTNQARYSLVLWDSTNAILRFGQARSRPVANDRLSVLVRRQNSDSVGESQVGAGFATPSAWTIAFSRINFPSRGAINNVNGSADQSATLTAITAGNSSNENLGKVSLMGYATSALSGDMAECIFGTGPLTQTDVDKLTGYLAHKWGITAGLPGGHPYKSVAPTW